MLQYPLTRQRLKLYFPFFMLRLMWRKHHGPFLQQMLKDRLRKWDGWPWFLGLRWFLTNAKQPSRLRVSCKLF